MASAPQRGYDDAMAARYDDDWRAIEMARQDAAFYTQLLDRSRGTVVEVGAGTGRLALPVAQAAGSRQVVAVEPSPGMREGFHERLERDPRANVTVVDGHFGRVPLADGAAGYVFSGFRAFQHLLTAGEQLAALYELQRVLRPGGVLAFDLFEPNPELLTSTGWELMVSDDDERGLTRSRYDRREHDRNAQTVTVRMRWEVARPDGEVSRAESSYGVRYLFRYELEHLLARAGLTDYTLYGGFDWTPVDQRIRELIVVARTPTT